MPAWTKQVVLLKKRLTFLKKRPTFFQKRPTFFHGRPTYENSQRGVFFPFQRPLFPGARLFHYPFLFTSMPSVVETVSFVFAGV